MLNTRFIWVVASSIFMVLWAIPYANHMIKHADEYSEEKKFRHALVIINSLRRRAFTKNIVFGRENVPKEGGMVLYSNHQGKYDALGILLALNVPCSVLWSEGPAKKFVARQVCQLINAVTINLDDMRDKVRAIVKATELVASGKRMLIFPEGGYEWDTHNNMQDFNSGCFSCSLKTKTPIVPVAIYDSYKSMNSNTFEPVKVQIHFLEPILYDEYGNLNKKELADLVKSRIQAKLDTIEAEVHNG